MRHIAIVRLYFSYWQRDIYSALYMLGMLFGSYFFGWVSDKFGRVNALMASVLTVSISGFLGYVSIITRPDCITIVTEPFVAGTGGIMASAS